MHDNKQSISKCYDLYSTYNQYFYMKIYHFQLFIVKNSCNIPKLNFQKSNFRIILKLTKYSIKRGKIHNRRRYVKTQLFIFANVARNVNEVGNFEN